MLLQTLDAAGVTTPFRLHGIPQQFLDHAKRARILERIGLDAPGTGSRHRRGHAALADLGVGEAVGGAPVDADKTV